MDIQRNIGGLGAGPGTAQRLRRQRHQRLFQRQAPREGRADAVLARSQRHRHFDAVFRQAARFGARRLVDVHRDPVAAVIGRMKRKGAAAARIQRQHIAGALVDIGVLHRAEIGGDRRARGQTRGGAADAARNTDIAIH